jgi:hypothetical protein
MLCSALSIALEHAFIAKKKEFLVKDLKLVDMLKDTEKSDRWRVLLNMFGEENMADALEIINQFPNEMDLFIRQEMKDRKLESLKMEFLD